MNSRLFQNFIDAISLLTVSQINILNEALAFVAVTKAGDDDAEAMRSGCDGSQASVSAPDTPDLEHMIESRFAQYPVCKCCGSGDVIRWGKRNGRQRYRCPPCKCTFTAFTNTPLAKLRHPEKWGKYLEGMTHSMPLRPAAEVCDINLKTAFRWRHRFLQVIEDDQADTLEGIVELDETFFRESFKGQRRGLPRPARQRGNDRNKARKVPVLVARDRERHTVDGMLANESANELCHHLNGRIRDDAVVCADAHLAHEKLAELLGFEFRELVTSSGKFVQDGIYHIQHVNAYHSHLKRWVLNVFHGVATKYMTHYLAWRRALTERHRLTTARMFEKIIGHWCYQPQEVT